MCAINDLWEYMELEIYISLGWGRGNVSFLGRGEETDIFCEGVGLGEYLPLKMVLPPLPPPPTRYRVCSYASNCTVSTLNFYFFISPSPLPPPPPPTHTHTQYTHNILQSLQWNPSNLDTLETEESVLISEVS